MNLIRKLFAACWSSLIVEVAGSENFYFRQGGPLRAHFQTGWKRMEQKEKITMLQTTTRTLLHLLVMITVTLAVGATESRIHGKASKRIRTLGKDTLGETLKEFRSRFPKAICGRAISTEINPQSLVNSGTGDQIHCCLNDRDSLTEFSEFRILNFD